MTVDEIVEKAEAIAVAECHRETHVRWLNFIREYDPDYRGDAGGEHHHATALRRYDLILKVLRRA